MRPTRDDEHTRAELVRIGCPVQLAEVGDEQQARGASEQRDRCARAVAHRRDRRRHDGDDDQVEQDGEQRDPNLVAAARVGELVRPQHRERGTAAENEDDPVDSVATKRRGARLVHDHGGCRGQHRGPEQPDEIGDPRGGQRIEVAGRDLCEWAGSDRNGEQHPPAAAVDVGSCDQGDEGDGDGPRHQVESTQPPTGHGREARSTDDRDDGGQHRRGEQHPSERRA